VTPRHMSFEGSSAGASPRLLQKQRSQSQPLLARPALLHRHLLKPVEAWDEDDVVQWVSHLSPVHQDFADLLYEHGISGTVLLTLSEEDVKGLGLKFGYQRLLSIAAAELRKFADGFDGLHEHLDVPEGPPTDRSSARSHVIRMSTNTGDPSSALSISLESTPVLSNRPLRGSGGPEGVRTTPAVRDSTPKPLQHNRSVQKLPQSPPMQAAATVAAAPVVPPGGVPSIRPQVVLAPRAAPYYGGGMPSHSPALRVGRVSLSSSSLAKSMSPQRKVAPAPPNRAAVSCWQSARGMPMPGSPVPMVRIAQCVQR